MNNYKDIIIAPIITEKGASLEDANTYVFKVSLKANKTSIKQAIENIFKVKVMNVRTVNSHPKKKRVGRYTGMTNKYKKAYVTLKEGNSISFD